MDTVKLVAAILAASLVQKSTFAALNNKEPKVCAVKAIEFYDAILGHLQARRS